MCWGPSDPTTTRLAKRKPTRPKPDKSPPNSASLYEIEMLSLALHAANKKNPRHKSGPRQLPGGPPSVIQFENVVAFADPVASHPNPGRQPPPWPFGFVPLVTFSGLSNSRLL